MQERVVLGGCRPCKRRRKHQVPSADLRQHLHLSSSSGKWLLFPFGSRPWQPQLTKRHRRRARLPAPLRRQQGSKHSRRRTGRSSPSSTISDLAGHGAAEQQHDTAVPSPAPRLNGQDCKLGLQQAAAAVPEPGQQPSSSSSSSLARMSPPLPFPATPALSSEAIPWRQQQQQQQQEEEEEAASQHDGTTDEGVIKAQQQQREEQQLQQQIQEAQRLRVPLGFVPQARRLEAKVNSMLQAVWPLSAQQRQLLEEKLQQQQQVQQMQMQQQQQQQQQDDDGPIEISSDDSSDEDEQQHGPIPPLQASGAAAALALPGLKPHSADAAAAYIAALAGAAPVCVQHPQPSSLGSGQATSWAAVQARLGGLARPAAVGRRSRGTATTTLLRKDFGLLLLLTEWLNDELVNYYLLLLQLRSDAILQLQARLRAALQQLGACPSSLPHQLRVLLRVPRSYAFSSFFYAQLAPGQGRFCYQAVQRWTRPQATHTSECVLAYQLLLFPINLGNTHWAVAAVWPQAGLLQYFDPLPGRREGRRVLASLARWLLQDAADKGVALPCRRARQLRLEHAPPGLPVQRDRHSCGVFAAAVCERLAAGWHAPFEFSQDDCPSLRLGMAADMLAGAVGW